LRANSTDLACYSIASILYNTERWATDIVQASVSRHATCGVTHSTEAEAYSLQHTDEWIALAQCVLQLVREFHVHVMQYRSQRMTPADTLQLDTNLPFLEIVTHFEQASQSLRFVWHNIVIPLELWAPIALQHSNEQQEQQRQHIYSITCRFGAYRECLMAINSVTNKTAAAWLLSAMYQIACACASHSLEYRVAYRLMCACFAPFAMRLEHWLSSAQLWDSKRWFIVRRSQLEHKHISLWQHEYTTDLLGISRCSLSHSLCVCHLY
jgi:hypothetical protein